MNRPSESGLEIKPPTTLEVVAQPDENKYYVENERLDQTVYALPNQSHQLEKYYVGRRGSTDPASALHTKSHHSGERSQGRPRVFWVLAAIGVICLAIALGAGLGAGLAAQRKSSPYRWAHSA